MNGDIRSRLGLDDTATAKLAAHGIRPLRDFALEFHLPEQHPALASLLGISVEAAAALAAAAAETVPADDLAALAEIARRIRTIPAGALPPKAGGTP